MKTRVVARIWTLTLLLALLTAAVGLTPAQPARAATITVCASGCDYTTIKAAVAAASSGDTITVAAGTYTEAGITVDKDLTITGAGASTTIVQAAATPGAATDRVFYINTGVTAVIEGLTLRYGKASAYGGGINNQGALTLNRCTVSGNSAWIGGGGIDNAGALTLNQCAVSGNSATSHGGGIYNYQGTLTLNQCTVSGNSASYGGGIRNMTAVASISHSTLVSNTATLNDTTSGIYAQGAVTVTNSIVAYNGSAGNSNFATVSGGVITSGGYNVANAWNGVSTTTGDQTGDPLLGPLQDNSGETWTHALLAGSPAIDRIGNGVSGCVAGVSVDQRGAVRGGQVTPGDHRGGIACDSGAYEYDSNQKPNAVTLQGLAARGADIPLLLGGLFALGALAWVNRRR